jgi:hypothetical protein
VLRQFGESASTGPDTGVAVSAAGSNVIEYAHAMDLLTVDKKLSYVDATKRIGTPYVAAHFAADHLRFTASPHLDAQAIVSALILLVLAEVFRTGTRLAEDQSLTV